MRRSTRSAGVIMVIVAMLAAPTMGHDTWLVATTYNAAVGQHVTVNLNTGMEFPVSTAAVDPDRVAFLKILHDGKEHAPDTPEISGESLSTGFTPDSEGTWVAVLGLNPRLIELEAEQFNEYLQHDGLPQVLAYREAKGLLNEDAVEQYAKYPKALIQVGATLSDAPMQPVGAVIELVPMTNPYALSVGDTLEVQALFRGEPLPDAVISWSYAGLGEGFAGSVTTNEDGVAAVPIEKAGPFVIRMIHMEHLPGGDYEWESHWASLTFALKE